MGEGQLPTVLRASLCSAFLVPRSAAACKAGARQADAGATDAVGHSCMFDNQSRVEADDTIGLIQIDCLSSSRRNQRSIWEATRDGLSDPPGPASAAGRPIQTRRLLV